MKNFRKVLSKTFEKGLSKRFETFSKDNTYASAYVDTPSRGVTREGDASHTLYLIKRGVAL